MSRIKIEKDPEPNLRRIQFFLDELRSGNYEQTNTTMYKNGKYSCLGVACEAARKNRFSVSIKEDRFYGIRFYDNHSIILPYSVTRWYGFGYQNPTVRYKGIRTTLAHINDLWVPFSEIADLVEAEFFTKKKLVAA